MAELMNINNTSIYKDSLTYPERSKLNGLKKDSWITRFIQNVLKTIRSGYYVFSL